jgi:1-acyl-sn-glycerol-3-phosphate acyltransferase
MNEHHIAPTKVPVASTGSSSSLGYRVAKAALSGPLRFAYRVEVEGLNHLPDRGPVILAANHRSFMDSVFLALTSPRPIAFVAKAEYFDHPLTRWLFRGTGQIPLRRGTASGARHALAAAADVLAHGGILGIYPEGTRSRDGKLHRGNPGPARLALKSGAPIVPVGLVGTEAVQGPGERLPHPFRTVTVRFGQARRVASDGSGAGKAWLRGATDQVMQDIAALCGQQYVDQYAFPPAAV